LNSILVQNFENFEIIVVDDGSTDDTETYIRSIMDKRVTFVKHKENKGVCAARGTGTSLAKGKWVISLDSDSVVLSGGLKLMAEKLSETTKDIGSVLFLVYYEKLGKTPEGVTSAGHIEDLSIPALSPDNIKSFNIPFDLQDYMAWVDRNICSAAFICHRREVFETVQWPKDRRLESQFHLRIYKNYKGLFQRFVVGVIHEDAPFAISSDRTESGIKRSILSSASRATSHREILLEFGDEMKKCAPNFYYTNVWSAAYLYFQSGRRLKGLKYSLLSLWIRPSNWVVIPTIVVGLIGPKTMALFRKQKSIRQLAAAVLSRSRVS
jgi:glycosyltransferase involved in cell wall biosynthesis